MCRDISIEKMRSLNYFGLAAGNREPSCDHRGSVIRTWSSAYIGTDVDSSPGVGRSKRTVLDSVRCRAFVALLLLLSSRAFLNGDFT